VQVGIHSEERQMAARPATLADIQVGIPINPCSNPLTSSSDAPK
jgi:hypothetical protein